MGAPQRVVHRPPRGRGSAKRPTGSVSTSGGTRRRCRGCRSWRRRLFYCRRRKETGIAQQELRINERIRIPRVRVVGADGQQIGILETEEALRLASEQDLDLVEVAPQADPPVTRIMDYGKYKYE